MIRWIWADLVRPDDPVDRLMAVVLILALVSGAVAAVALVASVVQEMGYL